jgi:threonine dehydratase
VLFVFQETFRLCQKYCDGVVLVDNAQISAAIKDIFGETRSVLEPAGAVAVAGAEAYLKRYGIEVCVLSLGPGEGFTPCCL